MKKLVQTTLVLNKRVCKNLTRVEKKVKLCRYVEQGDPHQQRERTPPHGEGGAGEESQEALHVHQRAQLEEVQRREEEECGGGRRGRAWNTRPGLR